MAKNKKVANPVVEEEVVEQEVIENDAPVVKKGKATKAIVMKNGQIAHNPYTVEDHGEDFMELAEMYSKKVGGTIETE